MYQEVRKTAPQGHVELMDEVWRTIRELGITDDPDKLTEDGYLVEDIHKVRDAMYEELERGVVYDDDDLPSFFGRHGIEYADADDVGSARISVDNGHSFVEPAEALESVGMDVIVNLMDDTIRGKVHAELAPCTDEEFLVRYLELADDDLIIG